MKDTTNQVTRIPRPLGLTLLAQQTRKLSQSNNPIPDDIISKLIRYSIDNQMVIGNKKFTITEMATYLNIPYQHILKVYINYQNTLGKMLFGNKDKVQGAIFFEALKNILEDKAQISQQVRLLLASQGGSYKAFISGEVNNALKINNDVSKTILELYKALGSGPKVAIQNNLNLPSEPDKAIKSLSITEALHLLEDEGLLEISSTDPKHKSLIPKYGLEEAPEVRANRQGITRKDGIMTALPTNTQEPIPIPKSHDVRRVKEEGIDEEQFLG